MRAIAVIGSAWGDEGKGAAVDKLAASSEGALVIRHSGGAQAGHTVVTPNGTRHVFSHFGSGSLADAPTFLSEYFVVNPRIFVNELHELKKTNANIKLIIHPNALVTTPWDVEFNRALERKRGKGRHGSVGIGFGETIERSERGFPLYMKDLYGKNLLKAEMEHLINNWFHVRAKELDITIDNPSSILDNPITLEWYQHCHELSMHIKLDTLANVAKDHETLIFEGAQGLLLDQTRGMTFPHVTRSNTGLQNVIPLLEQLKIEELRAIYMMRPYFTRHGAGPLPGEGKHIPFNINDPTNKPGEWQGNLRIAPLDVKIIADAINTDLNDVRNFKVDPYVGISCLDQAKNRRTINKLFAELDFPRAILGSGPARNQYGLNYKFHSKRIQLYGS